MTGKCARLHLQLNVLQSMLNFCNRHSLNIALYHENTHRGDLCIRSVLQIDISFNKCCWNQWRVKHTFEIRKCALNSSWHVYRVEFEVYWQEMHHIMDCNDWKYMYRSFICKHLSLWNRQCGFMTATQNCLLFASTMAMIIPKLGAVRSSHPINDLI